MADGTAIEWTHRPGTKGETWNPIRARHKVTGKVGWHCTHASEGCRNCYAEGLNLNRRNLAFGTGLPYKPGHEKDIEIFLDGKTLGLPLRWRDPRTIFVCSMTDAFGAWVTDAMLDKMFAVAALCPQHTFIFLTKRAAQMREYLSALVWDNRPYRAYVRRPGWVAPDARDGDGVFLLAADQPWPLPNVWLGVSAERQQEADERIPELLATPAAVRFVSAEPLLGPIRIPGRYPVGDDGVIDTPALDWIIVGGESGPNARPMHPDWVRSIREQCAASGTAFFFKQWGEWAPGECASYAQTSTERVADLLSNLGEDARWSYGSISPKTSEEMHRDDEPDLWRIGKKRAGRLLDGVEHSAFPSSLEPRSRGRAA